MFHDFGGLMEGPWLRDCILYDKSSHQSKPLRSNLTAPLFYTSLWRLSFLQHKNISSYITHDKSDKKVNTIQKRTECVCVFLLFFTVGFFVSWDKNVVSNRSSWFNEISNLCIFVGRFIMLFLFSFLFFFFFLLLLLLLLVLVLVVVGPSSCLSLLLFFCSSCRLVSC